MTLPLFAAALLALLMSARQPAPTATPSPLPTQTPLPRAILSGGGATFATTRYPQRDDLFGFFASVSHEAAISFCRTSGPAALAVFTHAAESAQACLPGPLDFASTTVPLGERDAASSRGGIVQIPYAASSVALLYDNPDVTGALRLSIPTLCAIADGEITNWDRVPRDPTNPAGAAYPARQLRFVVRGDAADTTFALSNFLSSRAPGGEPACAGHGQRFALNDRFASALPRPLPSGADVRGMLQAADDDDAMLCVAGRARCAPLIAGSRSSGGPGTIGYAAATVAADGARALALGVARLYVVRDGIGRDEEPIADLPGVATSLKTYAVDRLLANFVPSGRPVPEVVPLEGSQRAGCVAVVPPAVYAFPQTGYPIVSVTYFEFAASGNGEKTEALRTLAALTNDGRNFGPKKIRTIDPDDASTGAQGVSVLPLPARRRDGIPRVAACIGR